MPWLAAVAARFTWEREMETLGPLLGNARTVMILTQKPVDYQARTARRIPLFLLSRA